MKHSDDMMHDKMLRDIEVLARLKKEEDENYSMIIAGIRRRRISRMIIRSVYSCAAVIMLALILNHTFREERSILDQIESPTLITDSGERVELDKDNSYTLEFSEEKAPKPVISGPDPQPEAVDDIKIDRKVSGSMTAAAAVTKNTVIIPQGYTYNIKFDDGTEAYINSGSYIEFPKSFNGKETRRVELTGEAYFKVAVSDKPFIVSANGVEIKVYGTEFNVNTNRKGRVETILVSGSVGVRKEGTEDEVMMSPDQLLTYDIQNGTSVTQHVNPEEYLAWMTGDFTYISRPLSELLEDISSFYNIEIEKDHHFQEQLITISLSRKLGHRQLMEILESALGLEFANTGKKTYKCKTNY